MPCALLSFSVESQKRLYSSIACQIQTPVMHGLSTLGLIERQRVITKGICDQYRSTLHSRCLTIQKFTVHYHPLGHLSPEIYRLVYMWLPSWNPRPRRATSLSVLSCWRWADDISVTLCFHSEIVIACIIILWMCRPILKILGTRKILLRLGDGVAAWVVQHMKNKDVGWSRRHRVKKGGESEGRCDCVSRQHWWR